MINRMIRCRDVGFTIGNIYYSKSLRAIPFAAQNFHSLITLKNQVEFEKIKETSEENSNNIFHKKDAKTEEDIKKEMIVLQNKIKENPKNASYIFQYARLLHNMKEFDDALYFYNQAIIMLTSDGDNNEKVDEQIPCEILIHRGMLFRHFGKFGEAINDFNQVLEMNPSNTRALEYRCTVYSEMGEYVKSLEDCENLLRLDKSNERGLINKAILLSQIHPNDEKLILDAFDEANQILPNNVSLLYNQANILTRLGRVDDAKAYFERAMSLNDQAMSKISVKGDQSFENLYHRAYILCGLQKFKEAGKIFDKLIELQPYNAEFLFYRGICYSRMHRITDATYFFDLYLEFKPNDIRALEEKALNSYKYLTFKRLNEALSLLQQCVELEPDNVRVRKTLETLEGKIDRVKSAIFRRYCIMAIFIGMFSAPLSYIILTSG